MTAQILQFPSPTKAPETEAPKPRRTTRTRPKMRVEQVRVTCTRVPRKQHADLRTLSGVLTLDWKGDVPWTATFDPDDESTPNIVAPVEKLTRDDTVIKVACDEGTWTFTPITDDEGDEDDEDEDDDGDDEEE